MTSSRRLARRAALLLCVWICAALLSLGGCALNVKPSGQVVTDVSVGR
ncbi:hypothetical protein [Desulfovibrio desulfuricans]